MFLYKPVAVAVAATVFSV